ncbi:hypothetical protein AB0M43_36430 [Longispora sp. NPDC051575]|uniref:hypothetical protein n=1 Tax=Longispora sp. NPDC051575 TaxID=3154943 RepID=UPI003444C1FF
MGSADDRPNLADVICDLVVHNAPDATASIVRDDATGDYRIAASSEAPPGSTLVSTRQQVHRLMITTGTAASDLSHRYYRLVFAGRVLVAALPAAGSNPSLSARPAGGRR